MHDSNANPSSSFCDLHGLVKPGKEMLAPYAESFRQKWNQAIQYSTSCASDFVKHTFGRRPSKASGVCWYIKWEQMMQIAKYNPKEIKKG